jgi:hypothetical protein
VEEMRERVNLEREEKMFSLGFLFFFCPGF